MYVQDALDRYAPIPDDSDVTVDTDGNTVRAGDGGGVRHLSGQPDPVPGAEADVVLAPVPAEAEPVAVMKQVRALA